MIGTYDLMMVVVVGPRVALSLDAPWHLEADALDPESHPGSHLYHTQQQKGAEEPWVQKEGDDESKLRSSSGSSMAVDKRKAHHSPFTGNGR